MTQPPVRAWPGWARGVSAGLVAISRASLPLLTFAFAFDTTIPPRVIGGVLLGLGALPAAAAWLLGRAFAADVEVGADALRVRRSDATIEIPLYSLAALEPWRIPLPGAGVALRLASGARAPFGLEPAPSLLTRRFGVTHPNLAFAAARHAAPLAWLRRPLVRFGHFGLLPTVALFHAHQMITWGAPLGQYYTEGLGPWLASFAGTWLSTVVGIVMYASLVRAVVEVFAFGGTWASPRSAAPMRHAAEWSAAIAYYLGVPAYLAFRFFT